MRFIQKNSEPVSISRWRERQEPVGLNLDYCSFTRKPALRKELIAEQFGLCAYTGAPVDDRMTGRDTDKLTFQAHIEHIKPRSICRQELESRGEEYGRVLCEDLDHRNLVAALEVKRKPPAKVEIFGAAAHADEMLPVTPVQDNCEMRFRFSNNGQIDGVDDGAMRTVRLLKLDHATLEAWRRGAIEAFFPPEEELTREDVQQRIDKLTTPTDGKLPEFSFCIAGYARSLLSAR